MGNLIRIDGELWHQSGDTRERIAVDDLGNVLVGILHDDEVSAWRDDTRIVLSIGGTLVSVPAAVSVDVIKAMAAITPDAAAEEVAQRVAAETAQLERARQDARANVEADVRAHADALEAAAQAAIEAKHREIERLDAEIEKRKEAADAPARL